MQRPQHTSGSAHANADDVIGAELRARGLRSTAARRLILSALRDTPSHPTVDELRALLKTLGREVSVATVYQNLVRLADPGLVTRFLDSRGLLRFDANTARHHHLLCTSCGRIVDVDLDEQGDRRLNHVAKELASEHAAWQLEEAQLELRGRCPTCRGSGRYRTQA